MREVDRMAIEAKTSFLHQMEKRLETTTTADTMARVLSITADVMEGFDMREIGIEEETDDMLECFLQAMDVQGRSPKTIAHYRLILGKLLVEVKVSARRVTVYHLRSYLAKQKERGLKDSTLAHHREVFSSFFGWLFREGLIEKNPVVNLGNIKVAKEEKKVFSDIDMEKMKQHGRRAIDKAIITFLASTGCRVAELVGLDRTALDLENLECVVRGKGNKERTVYIDSVTAMYVKKYLATRTDDNPALFVTRTQERFNTGGIRDMLRRLEERSGVEHIHPHKFRRTLATNLARRNMPIQTIAAILGHEKIETTMEYIVMNKENTKIQYRQYYAG